MPINRLGVDTDSFKREDGQVGRRKTQGLFEEGIVLYRDDVAAKADKPVYMLRSAADTKCPTPSLKDLYMEIGDPTEYRFAIEAFGSWDYWIAILGGSFDGPFPKYLAPHIEQWREELEIKLRSEGIRDLRGLSGTKAQAASYFANGDFVKRRGVTGNRRGRPSNEEVQRELAIQAEAIRAANEDASRLGL